MSENEPRDRSSDPAAGGGRHEDGLLDLYIGLSIFFVGLGFLWNMFAPALLFGLAVPPTWSGLRSRFVSPRMGTAGRRAADPALEARLKRGGVITFLSAVILGSVLFAVRTSFDSLSHMDYLIFGCVLCGALGGLGVRFQLRRLALYTALVALAFLLAPTLGGRPALPHTLMCAAAAILANGTVQFTHFLGTHQPVDEQRDDAP